MLIWDLENLLLEQLDIPSRQLTTHAAQQRCERARQSGRRTSR